MPETEDMQRFDQLLEAMVTKPLPEPAPDGEADQSDGDDD